MAVKNHSLDKKIEDAAREEFLNCGFQKASLRKICEKAGITTGALYTRYENKDMLFYSLVKGAFADIGENFEPLKKSYMAVKNSPTAEKLIEVIRNEEKIYLDLMLRYYGECILFFCKSDGSNVQKKVQNMMNSKASETVEFLKSVAKHEFNTESVEILMSEQFNFYKQILNRGYSREKALECMKAVEEFLEAGWKDLFQKIL